MTISERYDGVFDGRDSSFAKSPRGATVDRAGAFLLPALFLDARGMLGTCFCACC